VIPGIACHRAQLDPCIGLLSEHDFSAIEVVAKDISEFMLGIYRGGVFSCACLNMDYPVLSVVDTTDGGEREKSKPHVETVGLLFTATFAASSYSENIESCL
jgi:hypothetical protein